MNLKAFADGGSGQTKTSAESRIMFIRGLLQQGRLEEARKASNALLADHPTHPGALIQRSRLESADDQYRVAREYALAAWRVGVRNKRQCGLLLRALRTYNLIAEFRDLVSGLPDDIARDPEIAVLVAQLSESFNEPDLALRFADRALRDHTDSVPLHAACGFALLNLGRFEEAERHLLDCLRLDPAHARSWWHLARLRKHTAESNHVDGLRQQIGRTSEPHHKALLAFALHKELDDLGEYADAAQALELACAQMRLVVTYSVEEDARLFAALKSLTDRDPAIRASEWTDAPFTPVFIVGMHRSGTTLLEQLLSGHPDVCAGGELYDFTSQLRFAADHHCGAELDLRIVEAADSFDYAAIGRGYLASIDRRRNGQHFVTDKLPSNFRNIGFILRALPNAKILHMSREPMETCFSNLREPFSKTTCLYSYDQAELGGYYRQYFDLMQHWRQQFPGRIHDVTYTALATNPAAELKRVAAYLGFEYQASMLEQDASSRKVTTASAVQVRQKVKLPDQPKWLPYREFLTPLAWRLSDIGQRR